MARLDPHLEWTIHLTSDELLLVLKALGGRLKEEEYDAAEVLGDKLSELRAKATQHALNSNDKLLRSLDEKRGDDLAISSKKT